MIGVLVVTHGSAFALALALLWWRDRFARRAWHAGFALGSTPPREDIVLPIWSDVIVRVLISLSGLVAFLFSATSAGIAFAGQGPTPRACI